MSRLRSGNVPSRCPSMNRGAVSNGRATSTAGLNRSVWPTASVAPRARARATSASASSSVRASGFSINTAVPASRNGLATAACDAVGVAMTTASTTPTSEVASSITRRAVGVGDLARTLEIGVDHSCQIDARHAGEDPGVVPPEVSDANDCDSHRVPAGRHPLTSRPTMAMPAALAASITACPSTNSALPASTDSAVAPMSRSTSMVRTPTTGTSKRMS